MLYRVKTEAMFCQEGFYEADSELEAVRQAYEGPRNAIPVTCGVTVERVYFTDEDD